MDFDGKSNCIKILYNDSKYFKCNNTSCARLTSYYSFVGNCDALSGIFLEQSYITTVKYSTICFAFIYFHLKIKIGTI